MPPQEPNQNPYNYNNPNGSGQNPVPPGQTPYGPPQSSGQIPYVSAPQPNPNQYDFFLKSPPKKISLKLGGPDGLLKTNFKLVVGAAVGFIIILLLLLNAFSGGSKQPTAAIRILQTQQDLITSSTAGMQSAVSQPAKDLAINVNTTVTTFQTQFIAYLISHGATLTTAEVGADANTAVGVKAAADLTNAQATSTYDPVYVTLTQQQLQAYAAALQADFVKVKTANPTEANLLNNYYKGLQALIKQADDTSAQLPNT